MELLTRYQRRSTIEPWGQGGRRRSLYGDKVVYRTVAELCEQHDARWMRCSTYTTPHSFINTSGVLVARQPAGNTNRDSGHGRAG